VIAKDASPSWRAVYQTDDGKLTWDVDVESLACPISCITPESLSVVQKFFAARRAHKLGGVFYGPDSSLWPARWFEAVSILQHELEREESAAQKAINTRATQH
jgi:hypothetical protein